jgi:hypothetical protein
MEKTYTLDLTKDGLFFVLKVLETSIALYAIMASIPAETFDSLAKKIGKAGEDA